MRFPGFLLPVVGVLAACGGSDTQTVDPSQATGAPTVAIFLIAHEQHTGIAVPRADIPAGLWPEVRDFPRADYLEVGWGERDYYFGRDQGAWGTLEAGLWPTPSVLHVVGIRGPPARNFPQSEIIALQVSRAGFARLIRYIDDAYERSVAGAVDSIGPGLYGDSRFYPGRESFHLFRTCNVWTAHGLRTAGLSIHDSITREGLMSQAREIGLVVNEP